MADERFTISSLNAGYYYVSIPNYEGGEVVRAEAYDALRDAVTAEIHRQCAHCKNGLAWSDDGRAHYGYEHQGVTGIVSCTASRQLRVGTQPKGLNYTAMNKLKPCPFCGSKNLDDTCRDREGTGARREFFYVFCGVCEASGPTDYVQANAIERWNERAKEN